MISLPLVFGSQDIMRTFGMIDLISNMEPADDVNKVGTGVTCPYYRHVQLWVYVRTYLCLYSYCCLYVRTYVRTRAADNAEHHGVR